MREVGDTDFARVAVKRFSGTELDTIPHSFEALPVTTGDTVRIRLSDFVGVPAVDLQVNFVPD